MDSREKAYEIIGKVEDYIYKSTGNELHSLIMDALNEAKREGMEEAAKLNGSCTHQHASSCCAVGMAEEIRARAQEVK